MKKIIVNGIPEAYTRLRPVPAECIPYWADQFGETDFTWTIRLMKTRCDKKKAAM